jgi:hypothetical protein
VYPLIVSGSPAVAQDTPIASNIVLDASFDVGCSMVGWGEDEYREGFSTSEVRVCNGVRVEM